MPECYFVLNNPIAKGFLLAEDTVWEYRFMKLESEQAYRKALIGTMMQRQREYHVSSIHNPENIEDFPDFVKDMLNDPQGNKWHDLYHQIQGPVEIFILTKWVYNPFDIIEALPEDAISLEEALKLGLTS